ncbi:LytTR family DNA-binding domain-containing protein [Flavobacterium sp. SUN046]|uniref:LytR/AlgR family response regulator transcription factor n=1 Tax=Flavobacterium sp. SUN046 TaxID=3002440 RepID=UPI002DBE4390|nr:LytTR family DNA-binding domain-containing protein [Flavobacterium sp. SUN046]MEC4048480.1 LytTR family DNA-binding domain-containing protein [Flavobacterium sp. SUN046]
MKCIIIDDEQMSREILSIMISNTIGLHLVDQFSSAIDAIKYLNQNEVDLIFLDIHMPNFTGFDFIQTIKNPPKVILVTTDKNFAIDAFNYDCIVDYLVKPIETNRFISAIKRVNAKTKDVKPMETIGLTTKEIYVNIDKRLIKIDLLSINNIQANGDYICIKTETQNYVVHTTMKKIEEKLPKPLFLKIHRSHIINVNKIIDIQDNSVLIAKEVIPISKKNKDELMTHLNLL